MKTMMMKMTMKPMMERTMNKKTIWIIVIIALIILVVLLVKLKKKKVLNPKMIKKSRRKG